MVRARQRQRPAQAAAVPDKQKSNGADMRRWIALAYQIIEYKIMYYNPELIKEGYQQGLTISDDAYDALEIEYLKLCLKLDKPNSVVHKEYAGLEGVKGAGMMEVDFTRPVVHLIMRKYGVKDWQVKVFGKEVYADVSNILA